MSVQDEDEQPHPLDVSRLKFQLQYGDRAARSDAIRNIIALGDAAVPLVGDVVALYRSGQPCATSSLVELYVATSAPEILVALRDSGDLFKLGPADQCELLKWGVSDLEPQLLEYLHNHWNEDDNSDRRLIVDALAVVGSESALEMLKVISVDITDKLPEENLNASAQAPIEEVILKRLKARSRQDFRETVRSAIRQIAKRVPEE